MKQCVEILKIGEVCHTDDECQVSLVCAKTAKKEVLTCQKFYSLEIGETSFDGRMCKSGTINSKNQCAKTSIIKQNKKLLL